MLDYFEQIEDYKLGLLSDEKRFTFEAELETNSELKSAVVQFDLLREISLGYLEEEVRAVLNEGGLIDSKSENSSTSGKGLKSKHYNWVWWLLCTILGIGLFLYFTQAQKENTLYEQRIEIAMNDYTPPQVVFERSGANNHAAAHLSVMNQAKQLFSLKSYPASKSLLLSLDSDHRTQKWYRLMAHISFIEKDFCKALIYIDALPYKSDYTMELNILKSKIEAIYSPQTPCKKK